MQSQNSSTNKPLLTPKSIIHQKFGTKACFTIEEVEEQSNSGCPGLSLPQKGPSLFICRLKIQELGFDVVSPPCKRKKEAEQSASLLALQKLGIDPQKGSTTISDAEDELVARLSYIFSIEELWVKMVFPPNQHLRMTPLDLELQASVPLARLWGFSILDQIYFAVWSGAYFPILSLFSSCT